MKTNTKFRVALVLLLLIASIALLVTKKPNSKTESYNESNSVLAAAGENKQINKVISWIKRATPTLTITPIPISPTTTNSNTASSPTPAPTNQLAQASPTTMAAASTPTLTPTSSTVSGPTTTPAPTLTSAPTVAPTATPAQSANTSISLYLTPPGNYTPEARADLNMEVIKNANGYWDFFLTGEITKLMPSREYQVWLCGINCSSNTEARFNSNEDGSKALANVKISGHNQKGDPLNRIVIYEMPQPGEIISDPTSCWMVSNDSISCLKREFGLGN